MIGPSGYQMNTLSTTLKPSVKKKPAKRTQGKIVPVPKRNNPYGQQAKPPGTGSTRTPDLYSTNRQGVAAQQAAQTAKPTPSTQFSVSYESDPVLARIRALGTQDVANARSEAEALRKKAILESGLADVGAEIGVDQATLQAAQQNPFSTRAQIERTQQERGRELDESLNQQNLFYGGYRAQQLADLARSGAEQQSALTGDIRSLLGGINQGVTSAEQEAARREQETLAQVAEQERLAGLQQAFLDALYGGGLADPVETSLGLAGTAPYPTIPELGMDTGMLDPAIAEAAGVDPYYYDPYEPGLAEMLAENSIMNVPLRAY